MMITPEVEEDLKSTDIEVTDPKSLTPFNQPGGDIDNHPELTDELHDKDDITPTASSPEQAYFLSFS